MIDKNSLFNLIIISHSFSFDYRSHDIMVLRFWLQPVHMGRSDIWALAPGKTPRYQDAKWINIITRSTYFELKSIRLSLTFQLTRVKLALGLVETEPLPPKDSVTPHAPATRVRWNAMYESCAFMSSRNFKNIFFVFD